MAQARMVLIAEDEILIRIVAVEIFSEAGFDVLEAEHADEALELLGDRADEVHLLFTDIHMPGSRNGLELAHHVYGHWPHIALLITSGGHQHLLPTEMPAGCRFLPKPYVSDDVMAHVKELLPL
jgi:two-component system, response regulator PdtaR